MSKKYKSIYFYEHDQSSTNSILQLIDHDPYV